jgi:hypothetical protein
MQYHLQAQLKHVPRTPWRNVALWLAAVTLIANVQAEDKSWYQNAKFSCEDPFSLEHSYMDGGWYSKYLDLRLTSVSNERGYLPFPKMDYDSLSKNTNGILFEKHTLSKQEAGTLRSILSSAAADKVVPVTAAVTSAVLGYIGAASFVTTGLLKYLTTVDASQRVDARVLAAVTAEGGDLDRLLTAVKTTDAKPYLVHTFEYAVRVGAEERHYVTVSCTYPVKLLFSEFRTTQPANKKLLRYFSGATWKLINADTMTEEATWIETDRDDDYLYFAESSTNIYRVGLTDGAIQKNVAGTWFYVYRDIISQ